MARIDDEMRAATLVRIRDLPGENCLKLLIRHPRSGKDTRSLHSGIGGNDKHGITIPVTTHFEQQGNIEDNERITCFFGSLQKIRSGLPNQRVATRRPTSSPEREQAGLRLLVDPQPRQRGRHQRARREPHRRLRRDHGQHHLPEL